MGILLGETHLGAWLSNLSTLVSFGCEVPTSRLPPLCEEMLTPVDQPLDTLADLRPDEMCALFVFEFSQVTDLLSLRDNMKGWSHSDPSVRILHRFVRLDRTLLKQIHYLWQACRK